jgi:hypothetical protein
LFNETLVCWKDEWIENNLGIFNNKDQYNYAVHFGPGKRTTFDKSNPHWELCTQNILETFFKYFPHLSINVLNLLEKGHV